MFSTLTWLSWLQLGAAVWLILGPGYALLSLYPDPRRLNWTQKSTLTIALAISFWAIALAWLGLIRARLSPSTVGIIMATGWVVGLVRQQPWRSRYQPKLCFQVDASRFLLWIVVIAVGVIAVSSLQSVLVGPGSDSYHHSLITQLIAERGAIPDNYQPYAPLVSFTYHYGFHAFAAVIVMLTGTTSVVITPVLAQLFTAAAALSVAFFAQATTGSRLAAAASAVIAGLISVFPAYFINWGRYTQLTGMVLLPVFLGLVWLWAKNGWESLDTILIGVLAAGIALTHYRVTLMAASGAIVLLLIGKSTCRADWNKQFLKLWGVSRQLLMIAVGVIILTAPWLWHVLKAQTVGYPIVLSAVGPAFFSLDRLGPSVSHYPSNQVLIILLCVSILLGLIWRNRLVIGLTLWGAVMLFLSAPYLAGTFMDTVSVVISLYFPVAVIIGGTIAQIADWSTTHRPVLSGLVWTSLIGLAIWGIVLSRSILEPAAAYVWADDLPAIAWVQEHTPSTAHFMVNTYNWSFSPDFIISIDAGYWLPLLAHRSTVTSPMTYPNERAAAPDFLSNLVKLHRLAGDLTSSQALSALREQGVTHVYIGARSTTMGLVSVEKLRTSQDLELIYQNGGAYVFKLRH